MTTENQSLLVPKLRFPEFCAGSSEWNTQRLDESSAAVFDGTHRTPQYTEEGVPFYSVENLISGVANKHISRKAHLDATRKNKPEKGDILLTRIGKIGYSKAVTWDHEFSVYVTVAVIKAASSFHTEYLEQYFRSRFYQDQLTRKSLLNATPPKINMDDLRSTVVLLPDMPEQQRIADCLGSLDDLIAAQEQKLESLQQHKQGLMQNLFPRPGETVPKLRFPEFRNRGVWQTNRFGDFVSNSKEKFNPMNSDDNPYLVELENIESRTGKLIGVAKLDKQNSLKSKFGAGDVLFGKLRPYLRKFAKPDYDGVCTTEIWVLRSNTVSSAFLFYLIQTDRFYQLANISSGSRMPRADWINLADANFQVPDRDERGRIADCLGSLDDLIEHADRKLQTLKQQKQGLMQQLFPTAENLLAMSNLT